MRFRKVYGQSRVDTCPFCGKQGVTKNSQGVPTCLEHKKRELVNLKCMCGEWLDLREGKYGPYFNCMNCGNVSWAKAMELNPQTLKEEKSAPKPKQEKYEPPKPKEIQISTDDVSFFS